jgi:hypothetical protein
MRRLSTVVFTDLLDVERIKISKNHACDKWGRKAVSRKRDFINELHLLNDKLGISEADAIMRSHFKIEVRGTTIAKDNDIWKFIKITKMAVFQDRTDPSFGEFYLEFSPFEKKMYWSRCQGQELDFSIATHFFVDENVEREFMWLDNTVEFYGIIVDPSLTIYSHRIDTHVSMKLLDYTLIKLKLFK